MKPLETLVYVMLGSGSIDKADPNSLRRLVQPLHLGHVGLQLADAIGAAGVGGLKGWAITA